MKRLRVAVTGTTGRVGAALAHGLAAGHEVIPLPKAAFNLADPGAMARVLAGLRCDALLNPAGITGLEACLDDPAAADRVNHEAPGEMAAWAARHDVHLIHFSTDYVFDGAQPGLRSEGDPTGPLSDYGRSKRAGEQAVLAHPGTCVVRVSWVFGPEKPSFVDSIRSQALAGAPLAAVADKFSLPTFTTDLSEWIQAILADGTTGVLHACNSGEPVSWHGMACEVVRWLAEAGRLPRPLPEVGRQALAEVPGLRAARPMHSALGTGRLTGLLGAAPRPWRDALAAYLAGVP